MSFPRFIEKFRQAELSALKLDGDVTAIGSEYFSIDVPECVESRLESLFREIPDDAVVCGLTASWVYGATWMEPLRIDFCSDNETRLDRFRSSALAPHELKLSSKDVSEYGIRRITNPARTMQDLLRMSVVGTQSTTTKHSVDYVRTIRALIKKTGLDATRTKRELERAHRLPYKTEMLRRLSAVCGSE